MSNGGEATEAAAEDSDGRSVDLGTVEDTSVVRPTERKLAARLMFHREGMRGIIALILLFFVGVTLVWALTTVHSWAEMKELLEVWLPALTGLLGSAVGFYFGTRQ